MIGGIFDRNFKSVGFNVLKSTIYIYLHYPELSTYNNYIYVLYVIGYNLLHVILLYIYYLQN